MSRYQPNIGAWSGFMLAWHARRAAASGTAAAAAGPARISPSVIKKFNIHSGKNLTGRTGRDRAW